MKITKEQEEEILFVARTLGYRIVKTYFSGICIDSGGGEYYVVKIHDGYFTVMPSYFKLPGTQIFQALKEKYENHTGTER